MICNFKEIIDSNFIGQNGKCGVLVITFIFFKRKKFFFGEEKSESLPFKEVSIFNELLIIKQNLFLRDGET